MFDLRYLLSNIRIKYFNFFLFIFDLEYRHICTLLYIYTQYTIYIYTHTHIIKQNTHTQLFQKVHNRYSLIFYAGCIKKKKLA